MLRLLFAVVALILAPSGSAGLLDIYRLDDGHTNWQYLANTTATVLIITLSYTIFRLFRSHQETRQHNRDLEAIRGQLEERVKERTASLRQSESYLNDILRSMPMMLIGLDREAVVTQWNQRAEELTGLEAKDVVGRKLWQAYPLITVTPEQIQAVLESGKGRMIRQSQRGRFHFDVTIYPLDEQDEPGVVVLLDDVTERVMAQNSLVERDKLSSMGELAASLAHDISTPLQVIRRDIDKVRANINGTAAAEPLLDDALERAEQVSAVVGNLVQFSRAMADDMQPTSMTRLIDHSLDLASALLTVPSGLGFRDIRVERDFEDDLPEIPCHPTEMEQMFLSLFRHCNQALGEVERPGHEPLIRLQVNRFYDALWIKVQHNGRGLSLSEQQELFEPYFTATEHSALQDFDAGRRLSYAYFIVTEQHRGQLAVTSEVEIGTTFHIQLALT